MAEFILTHAPLLQSRAQLLILPVSSDGTILDPVINRCKTLYPDNYKTYRRYCMEGTLTTGTSLVYQRQREASGLATSTNATQPRYLVNFIALDHPYHPLRKRWLVNALDELYPKLFELIRYEGLRRIALLARPLIAKDPHAVQDNNAEKQNGAGKQNDADQAHANMRVPILDWQQDIYPLIVQKLKYLPKVTIDVHVPHNIDI